MGRHSASSFRWDLAVLSVTCQSITEAKSHHLQPVRLLVQVSEQIETKYSGALVSSQKTLFCFSWGPSALSKHSLFNPYRVTVANTSIEILQIGELWESKTFLLFA